MLYFNLRFICKARSIQNPSQFLIKAGIPAYAVSQLLNNNVQMLKLSHVELLCKALICEPSDLFAFKPTKGETYPNGHPLFNLQNMDQQESFEEMFAKLPFKAVKQAREIIIENIKLNDKKDNE